MSFALIFGIFLSALVSGWHCALMCGGIAAAIESPAPLLPRAALLRSQLMMHLGRVTAYTLLGALAGFMGQFAWRFSTLPVQRVLLAGAALLVLSQALRLFMIGSPAGGVRLKNSVAGLWVRAAGELQKRLASADLQSSQARLAVGLMWGLVPCGLVYAVLPIALLAGNAASGALVMLAFGLGTLPNLMLLSRFSAHLAQWGHRPWARRLAAGLMGAAGAFAFYRAVSLPDGLWRAGLCAV